MQTNLLKSNQKINFTGINGIAKNSISKFHPSAADLNALRQNYAEKEILFHQGHIGDCYLIAALKSIMFGLNEYANKTGKQQYNAKNWLKKLVIRDDKENAEIFFPVLAKLNAKIPVTKANINFFAGSQDNKKITFLECGYGILRKWTDKLVTNERWISDLLNSGMPDLAIKDVTGLKGVQLSQAKEDFKNEEDLKQTEKFFREHTEKLFKHFKEHPENLIIVAGTKSDVPNFLNKSHAYSVKKIIDDGLILVNPHSQTNEEINIKFEDFYKHFGNVDFARLRPEKMFKMIEETKKVVKNAPVLKLGTKPNFEPIRDSLKNDIKKGYLLVEDKYPD